MSISDALRAAEQFGVDLEKLSNNIAMPASLNNAAAAACFCIALDHYAAIVTLMNGGMHSSALALLRSICEAFFRGLWLQHCASARQVSAFLNGEQPPKTMIADIETLPMFSEKILSQVKKKNWDAMCAFTHTSGLHVRNWLHGHDVAPAFPDDLLENLLNEASLWAAQAGAALVRLNASRDQGKAILNLMKVRWPDS